MAFTTLIAENLIGGCLASAWIIALLFSVGALEGQHYENFKALAKDYSTLVLFVGTAVVYTLGGIVNAVSFICSSWMFARGSNRPSLEAVGAKTLNEVYVYVLQHGSGDLARAIDATAIPSMRISRSACLNLIALSLVLFLWRDGKMVPYAVICLCLGLIAIPVYYVTAKEWKDELFAAYDMLRQKQLQRPGQASG
jgi:hypothetical protein